MKRHPIIKHCVFALLTVCLLAGTVRASNNDVTAQARKILDTPGVQGGVVVHLGSGDGRLTAALRASDSLTVHGLEADPAMVTEARDYIHAQGIYGPVSVEQFSGSVLPYTDNLINLVFVQDQGNVTRSEVMRVLAPGGVACGRRGGQWRQITKPWPGNRWRTGSTVGPCNPGSLPNPRAGQAIPPGRWTWACFPQRSWLGDGPSARVPDVSRRTPCTGKLTERRKNFSSRVFGNCITSL